ncbi:MULTISPECIES: hypothetical protein [unclassified Brucella]|uniref:hypothetical protein n=1 Tax=unclassified Brucella TaxID=2632610 RepID=UPI0012AD6F72|nr:MULTISPECIES: hypothetical protein [unclassified Brucella]MRN43447.1 hypothetical protein [Brucella sp. 09RB8913]MRN59422.1 hypothetical protein [Brucella sp. 09RB8918]MRN67983.1 hypothetical protein [Brucella sp. 10RB9213]
MKNYSDREDRLAVSAQQPPRTPLAPVYQALETADDLARAVNNFLDVLYGAEPTSDGETASSIPDGVIPQLAELADRTRRRVARAFDRLGIAFKELSL